MEGSKFKSQWGKKFNYKYIYIYKGLHVTNIVQKPLMPLILQTRGRHFGSRVAFWSKP